MLFKKGVAEHCFRRIGVPFCLFVAIQSIIAAKIGDLRFSGNTGSAKKDDVLALLYQLGQTFDFFGHKDTPFRDFAIGEQGFKKIKFLVVENKFSTDFSYTKVCGGTGATPL